MSDHCVHSHRTYYLLHFNYRAASRTVIFEMGPSIGGANNGALQQGGGGAGGGWAGGGGGSSSGSNTGGGGGGGANGWMSGLIPYLNLQGVKPNSGFVLIVFLLDPLDPSDPPKKRHSRCVLTVVRFKRRFY